jgi:hypothetical protein
MPNSRESINRADKLLKENSAKKKNSFSTPQQTPNQHPGIRYQVDFPVTIFINNFPNSLQIVMNYNLKFPNLFVGCKHLAWLEQKHVESWLVAHVQEVELRCFFLYTQPPTKKSDYLLFVTHKIIKFIE